MSCSNDGATEMGSLRLQRKCDSTCSHGSLSSSTGSELEVGVGLANATVITITIAPAAGAC